LRRESTKRSVGEAGREPSPEFANLTVELLKPVHHSKRYAITNVDSLGVIERFTYTDITRETARWAQLLREKGLQPGDRVVIVAGREWGWRCALLGAIHAGGVAVPCPPSLPAREIRTVADHADASLLVSLRPPPELDELEGRSALTADDLEAIDPARALERPPHRTEPRDIALILYAWHGLDLSGTMHTHASLLAQADAAEHWLGVDEDERVWATAEDGSGPSIWLMLAAWRRAASVVVVDLELDSDAKLELLDRLRPAAVWFSDDEYATLGSAAVPPWVDLRSIRRAFVGSDETEGANSFSTTFGAALVPVFALDELGVVAGWPAGREGRGDAHTAQPAPGVQVAVVGGDGTELQAGEVGDVAVRGDAPTLFTGYAGREGRSRSAEWFRFGWRGALTAEGALRLEDRSPGEVEPVGASVDLSVPEVAEERKPAEQPVAAEPEGPDEEAEREVDAHEAEEADAARLVAEQEAKELAAAAAAEADERRRAEEEAKGRERAAAAEAKQQGDEEKRREKERQGEEKEARTRAEREAKEREKAEAEDRRHAEEEAKVAAKREAAEARRRAKDEKEREQREAEAAKVQAKIDAAEAKQRAKDDKERDQREAKERAEREKREAEAAKVQAKIDAAEAKQRAKDEKEREKREVIERVEREKAEAEAEKVRQKQAEVEAKQRAEDEKRREKEREREENEAKGRAEEEAKQAARAERKAEREEKRRAAEAPKPKPADDGHRRFGRRRREVVEEPEPAHAPDVVARIKQYGIAGASTERPAEPPEQPDDE
jgi:acyl-coenzyme A synthetase/AMP-(fatty) acid ligase